MKKKSKNVFILSKNLIKIPNGVNLESRSLRNKNYFVNINKSTDGSFLLEIFSIKDLNYLYKEYKNKGRVIRVLKRCDLYFDGLDKILDLDNYFT